MWINAQGQLYQSDCLVGDRAATPQEESTYQAAKAVVDAVNAATAQAKSDVMADTTIQYLKSHTSAEIAAYVQANVTDLATAKTVLAKLGAAVGAMLR